MMQSIPIKATKDIRPTGEHISKPTWNAKEGKSRQEQIHEARIEAFEATVAADLAEQPHNIRISKLEGAVARLQAQLALLTDAKTK